MNKVIAGWVVLGWVAICAAGVLATGRPVVLPAGQTALRMWVYQSAINPTAEAVECLRRGGDR
jgi:hypothetical protein